MLAAAEQGHDARTLSPSHPANLRKQVRLHLDPSFSVKSYIGAAATLLEKAQMADAQGNLEAAFVHYLTTASVASFVPKHAEWPELKKSRDATFLAYQELMNRTPEIVQRSQAIEAELAAREEHDEVDELSARLTALGEGSDAKGTEVGDEVRSSRSGSETPKDASRRDAVQDVAVPAVPSPRKRPPPRPPGEADAPTPSMPVPDGPVLPVDALWAYMYPGFDRTTDKAGGEVLVKRPGLHALLVDVRPRHVYDAGHLRGADSVCIDPALLRNAPVSPFELEEALDRSAPSEAARFKQRAAYDLLVLYDERTRAFGNAGAFTPEQTVLDTLVRALRPDLLHAPVLLRGGYDSWSRAVGDAGIVATPGATPPDLLETVRQSRHNTYHVNVPSKPQRTYQPPRPTSREIPASLLSGGGAPEHAHTGIAQVPQATPAPSSSVYRIPASLSAAGQRPAAPRRFLDARHEVRIGLSGLRNFGNTCYMNATLQCLSATVVLSRYMIEGRYKKAINLHNPLGTRGVLASAFAHLLQTMWSQQHASVSPHVFRQAIGRFAPAFSGGEQQDSQEFLTFLLDGIHEDLNLVQQRPTTELGDAQQEELNRLPPQLASIAEWGMYRRRNDSVVVDAFQGQLRNQLQCLTCGYTSRTYNAFLSLSLPVPHGRGMTQAALQQCLDMFVREEILDKSNAWRCPKCKKPRRATKRLSLARLPPILVVHLKRFMIKGPVTNKISTPVMFPTTGLDLSNYMPPPLPPGTAVQGIPSSESQRPPYLYDLYAVTHHFGCLTSGHYTATIRTQDDWFYCDDSRIARSDLAQLQAPLWRRTM
ncbi:Doa4p [Malassezia vespertilionis]|uniref:Ubiquitin carboxyl-terminal hydrolase n=1 Tax=Malassezia vespertilionis TaxID=2020962 RepID=A0A2N1JFT2_9BASI|nr:Doa4p [Malassezia vespertilionis]